MSQYEILKILLKQKKPERAKIIAQKANVTRANVVNTMAKLHKWGVIDFYEKSRKRYYFVINKEALKNLMKARKPVVVFRID